MAFELPKLDYANSALSPIMSEETLDLHHGKHHQTYITNLNNFIKDTDMADKSLEEIIVDSSKDKAKAGIFNNASQHWNHNLFWKCMKPSGGGKIPPKLEKRELLMIQVVLNNLKKILFKLEQHNLVQGGVGYQLVMANQS